MSLPSATDIVSFWRDAGPERWFKKDAAFDAEIRSRFLPAHEAAAAGQIQDWESSPEGSLALLILLDQFPRNMFRNDARAFATDAHARRIAANALVHGFDGQVGTDMRDFVYVPFMHSEDLRDQETAISLYAAAQSGNLKWANVHADIIRKFGRFPHRNAVLGRTTTPDEQAFLDSGGFSG